MTGHCSQKHNEIFPAAVFEILSKNATCIFRIYRGTFTACWGLLMSLFQRKAALQFAAVTPQSFWATWHIRDNLYLQWHLLGKWERESYSEPAVSCWEPDVCQFLRRADQSKPPVARFKVSTLSLNALTLAFKSCYRNYFAPHLSMKCFHSLSLSPTECEIRLSNLSLSFII